jgi:hypothetical protein
MLAPRPVGSLNHNPRFMGIPDSTFPENALATSIVPVMGLVHRGSGPAGGEASAPPQAGGFALLNDLELMHPPAAVLGDIDVALRIRRNPMRLIELTR